jgi:hypothetical protein
MTSAGGLALLEADQDDLFHGAFRRSATQSTFCDLCEHAVAARRAASSPE